MRLASGLALALCATGALAADASADPAATAPSAVRLDAHRAVYDLTLGIVREEAGIASAVGRIALEIHGDACDGYTTRVRQVVVIGADDGIGQTIDSNSATFEAADGALLKFRSETRAAGTTIESVDGQAARADGATTISLERSAEPSRVVSDAPLFPTEHVRLMIGAARSGERLVPARLFDGSGDGLTVYDTLALVGNERPPEGDAAPEALAPVAHLPSWPVRLSYFVEGEGEQLPEYEISFRLFENGVSSDLVFDFGAYALEGRLVSLDLIEPSGACEAP